MRLSKTQKTKDSRSKEKHCEVCKAVYTKAYNEPWGRWEKRRFCSHSCWWESRPNWNRYAKPETVS